MRPFLQFVCVIILTVFSGCNRSKPFLSESVKTTTIVVDSLKQIVLVSDSIVKPILYTNVSGIQYLPVPKAKATFISAVLPSILVARHRVEENKRKLLFLKGK